MDSWDIKKFWVVESTDEKYLYAVCMTLDEAKHHRSKAFLINPYFKISEIEYRNDDKIVRVDIGI